MLPFSIELKPGLPIAGQILFAVKKAVVTGQLRPGEKFPSVRQLSQDLRINPNTAHKVVAALVSEGVLITTPAVGSVVAAPASGDRRARAELLGPELERAIVEAKQLGLELDDVQAAVATHWRKLSESPKESSKS
jgi:GntR family transcriptional regulator